MGNVANESVSKYKDLEDRITASLMQILHYGGHEIVSYLFSEEDDIELPSNIIVLESQKKIGDSIPDGYVSCNCKYSIYIESKIDVKALSTDHGKIQLENHLKNIFKKDCQETTQETTYLYYLTPDTECPKELFEEMSKENRLKWMNWQKLDDRLNSFKTNDTLVCYLIKQFSIALKYALEKKGVRNAGTCFYPEEDNVIVVGGSSAEKVALKYDYYICQENRSFQPAKYLAFCFHHRIKYLFEIEEVVGESVDLSDIPELKCYLHDVEPKYPKDKRKVLKVKKVKEFTPEIENDKTDKNGNRCAFVQCQGYTSLEKINKAKKTSDL